MLRNFCLKTGVHELLLDDWGLGSAGLGWAGLSWAELGWAELGRILKTLGFWSFLPEMLQSHRYFDDFGYTGDELLKNLRF